MMERSTTTENDSRNSNLVDLPRLARAAPGRKPVWTHQGADLNLNLVSCTAGQGIGGHVNTEVDVLLVGIDGTGVVEIDGRQYPVQPGQAVIIPKGSHRAVHCDADDFAYLSCHRRRSGLMPAMRASRDDRDSDTG